MFAPAKNILLIILLTAIGLNAFSQNNWAKFGKAPYYGATTALGVDSMNNVYSVTPFQTQVTFDDTMYQVPFPDDGIVVHKYDSSGVKQWELVMRSNWIPVEEGVMLTDDSGNVYLTSVFDSSIVIGDSTFFQNSWAYQDFFFCKLNSDGVLQWIHTAEILGDSLDRGCYRTSTHKVDEKGNLYVMCNSLYGRPEVHKLYKIDKHGTIKWNMEIQIPTSSPQPNYISWDVDEEGFVYFANHIPLPFGYRIAILNKWDSTGTELWSKSLGDFTNILDIGLDANNNIYTVVRDYNLIPFKTFIIKYGSDGSYLWSDDQFYNPRNLFVKSNGEFISWGDAELNGEIVRFYIERQDSNGEFLGQLSMVTVIDSSNYIYKEVFQLMEKSGSIYACGDFSGEVGDVVVAGDTTSTAGWNNINFLTKISTASLDTTQILSVREATSNKLRAKLYPNPFTDNIVLECVSFSTSELEINLYDKMGRRVPSIEKTKISNNKVVLTTTNLAPGFYMLEFRTEGKTYIQRILKY